MRLKDNVFNKKKECHSHRNRSVTRSTFNQTDCLIAQTTDSMVCWSGECPRKTGEKPHHTSSSALV